MFARRAAVATALAVAVVGAVVATGQPVGQDPLASPDHPKVSGRSLAAMPDRSEPITDLPSALRRVERRLDFASVDQATLPRDVIAPKRSILAARAEYENSGEVFVALVRFDDGYVGVQEAYAIVLLDAVIGRGGACCVKRRNPIIADIVVRIDAYDGDVLMSSSL